jgi:hypothetical protein
MLTSRGFWQNHLGMAPISAPARETGNGAVGACSATSSGALATVARTPKVGRFAPIFVPSFTCGEGWARHPIEIILNLPIPRRNSYGFWTNAKLSSEAGVGFVRVDLRSPLQMSPTE